MKQGLLLRSLIPLLLAYALAGAAALAFTRYDGGVAFLWVATAILIAYLLRTPTRRWPLALALCGLVSAINTSVLGLGVAAALPFVVVNLGEALTAVLLLRRFKHSDDPLDSLGRFVRYVGAVGVAAPLVGASLAGVALLMLDRWSESAFYHVLAGHALGNLTFTPLALMVTGRRARQETLALLSTRRWEVAWLVPLVVATVSGVFLQSRYPLLFVPVLVITLATFRVGRAGAAISVALLALIGGLLTMAGYGPVQLVGADDVGTRMQFLQFYLAATVLTVLPVSADLHHRKRLLQRVRLSEERFRLLAEHSSDLLMHIAADGRFLFVSPSMRQIGGFDPDALIGTHSSALIAPEHLEHVRQQHWSTLKQPGATSRFQYQGIMADGSLRWFETHSRALVDEDGHFDGVLSIARDITETRAREKQLATAAMTDPLTGLPNRRALLSHADERQLSRSSGDCVAILDIDHFKQVNDLHGHHAGDEVLSAFAELMQGSLRPVDLPARIGGEEFVILFKDTSCEQALAICDRLRQQVAATPIVTAGGAIRITVSGGVAELGPNGIEAALRTADRALYKAKHSGRDQFRLAA